MSIASLPLCRLLDGLFELFEFGALFLRSAPTVFACGMSNHALTRLLISIPQLKNSIAHLLEIPFQIVLIL